MHRLLHEDQPPGVREWKRDRQLRMERPRVQHLRVAANLHQRRVREHRDLRRDAVLDRMLQERHLPRPRG